MSSVFDKLYSANLLNTPPAFLKNNIHYEVITGSTAYGCADTAKSDKDVYGFAIPPKDIIFPHQAGYITSGFDEEYPNFKNWQQHHITHDSDEYDIAIHNITHFFRLCMNNNPNMIDCLFVPLRCVIFTTQVGEHVRNNRKMFLHKGSFFKFRGYAKSQLSKLQAKQINNFIAMCKEHNLPLEIQTEDVLASKLPGDVKAKLQQLIKRIDSNGVRTKRIYSIAKYGYDVKFAYHLVRLLSEARQILDHHDLILDRDREMYKSIRRGDWNKDQVIDYFARNEISLEKACDNSTLPSRPDVNAIRQLLIDCLEMHYGSLEECVSSLDKHELAVRDIKQLLADRKL